LDRANIKVRPITIPKNEVINMRIEATKRSAMEEWFLVSPLVSEYQNADKHHIVTRKFSTSLLYVSMISFMVLSEYTYSIPLLPEK
jgi:hypothetical protein